MPSRLLTDALKVHLNSRGGSIEVRDRTETIERGTVEYRTPHATITQRLLKNGDRMVTVGEIEEAIGTQVRAPCTGWRGSRRRR